MDIERIAELLRLFLGPANSQDPRISIELSRQQLEYISIYIDILLRWNERMNLTAVRDPDGIVRRHFGESLFAAQELLSANDPNAIGHVIDVGSGAGFPGLPLKIWEPGIQLTLIESNHKKATFLREVCRALSLKDVEIFAGRAEDYSGSKGQLVTLRAVEKFEEILHVAGNLVAANGRIALLIGEAQVKLVHRLLSHFLWSESIPLPYSKSRILIQGAKS